MRYFILLLLFTPLTAIAGTFTAGSCNQIDVNACINSAAGSCSPTTHTAVNGDIIKVPAGSCTWSTGITIPSGIGITITGAGTPSGSAATFLPDASCTATVITDTATVSLFNFQPTFGNATSRISCMQISPGTPAPTASPINVSGTCNSSGCPNLRMDNITIPTAWTSCCSISDATFAITNNVFGVVDHNTFNWGNGGVLTNPGLQAYLGVGSWGDNSWAQPDTFGTTSALYIENNSFNGGGANDCDTPGVGGCRVVCRFNQATNLSQSELCYFHGTDTNQRTRGGRQMEMYGNNITGTGGSVDSIGENRSGVSRVFGNTVVNCGVCGSGTVGTFINTFMKLDPQRRWRGNTPFGPCDGSQVWDTNTGTVFFSGTISSTILSGPPNNYVIGLNVTGLTSGQWNPSGGSVFSVHDVTAPGSGNEIRSNTTTVINFSSNNVPPVNMTAADSYQILQATVCLDQPGRSQGTLYSGGDALHAPTPASAANQTLDPTYEWSDTGLPSGKTAVGSTTNSLIQNRDFYMENRNQVANTGCPGACTPFDGTTTIGMGHGTLAQQPTTCTTGVGYFATDQGAWNQSGNGFGQGKLYKCTATNTWTVIYEPFQYPHPLISGGAAVWLPQPNGRDYVNGGLNGKSYNNGINGANGRKYP